MVVRLNPVEFAKAMMKKKKQLVPTPIVLDNEIAGIVYGYYEGEDFYYLDRLDVDVSKKEELITLISNNLFRIPLDIFYQF